MTFKNFYNTMQSVIAQSFKGLNFQTSEKRKTRGHKNKGGQTVNVEVKPPEPERRTSGQC